MKTYKNFITFEGIDFSGKTTQHQRLLKRLKSMNIEVHFLREPGGTMISEKIREILLDKSHHEMHPRTEILLYSAARAQVVHQTLLPLLEAGKHVILDRFFDSTTVYQGYGRGLNIEFVTSLNRFATSGLIPYKTFLLDISPQTALDRRTTSGRSSDRLDNENLAFYQKIYNAYHKLVAENPDRYIIIPGEQPIDVIESIIWKKIREVWDL